MNNKVFNSTVLLKHLKQIGKIVLYLLLALIIGAFIGCGVAGSNPFAIFFPSTWTRLFQFLS
ncbi:DNA-directed RNA polymerase subunit beta [Lactobacillus sp.]|uniref:DNA-directed RNA polymerase subunit beta n=1 Tax=Lactobacillus sp. TaxID=1591 RepID=UPI00199FC5F1|nr:DNA-directed RNA polymerase subunit beta [Lactobacillus sp.]MBD5430442.1 DNA-directed RNA polymerase subunit beta [Lactobacillus sp.]